MVWDMTFSAIPWYQAFFAIPAWDGMGLVITMEYFKGLR